MVKPLPPVKVLLTVTLATFASRGSPSRRAKVHRAAADGGRRCPPWRRLRRWSPRVKLFCCDGDVAALAGAGKEDRVDDLVRGQGFRLNVSRTVSVGPAAASESCNS